MGKHTCFLWMILIWFFILIPTRDAVAAELEQNDSFYTIYDSIPLDEVEEVLQGMKEDDIDFSIRDYVGDILNGKLELSLAGMEEYIKTYIVGQFETGRNTIIRLILYGVLSGIFLNFSTGIYRRQMGETGFHIIYFLAVTLMVSGFFAVSTVAGDVLENVVGFMSALVPSFAVALTWSSGSATSLVFYQTAISAIAIAENILIRVFLPAVQVYFLISILNPLTDWKFTKFAGLIRSFIQFGTKMLLAIMIGHQGIQGLIMPALDGVKRSAFFKTASSLPGVGNAIGNVTDTVIGTGVLIKSAVGVGGLVAVCIICLIPLVKLGVFTVTYRALAALAQPVTDRRIVSVFQSTADSGKLLFFIVFMTAVMFLVTLTIVIAATNHISV